MVRLEFIHYSDKFEKELENFNNRVKKGGFTFKHPKYWQYYEGDIIKQDLYLLVEDGSTVRGVVAIKHQDYYINGEIKDFLDIQLPISEGFVNPSFSFHSLFLLKKVVKLSDDMHGLGMGGIDSPLPTILNSLNFSGTLIPYFCYPISIVQFIGLVIWHKSKIRISGISGISGKRFWAINLFNNFLEKLRLRTSVNAVLFDFFDEKEDVLWNSLKSNFHLIAVKDSQSLNAVYFKTNFDLKKFRIFAGDKYLGWVILKTTQHVDNKYFGNLITTSIVDMFCEPVNYKYFIRFCKQFAWREGAAILMVNTSFEIFNKSLRKSWFIKLPSNFGFVYKSSTKFEVEKAWITRADGDGPINI